MNSALLLDLSALFGAGFLLNGLLWAVSFGFRVMKKAADMAATE